MIDTIQLAEECGAIARIRASLNTSSDSIIFLPEELEYFRKRIEDEMKERGDQLKPDMAYMRTLEERCDNLQKELDNCKDTVALLQKFASEHCYHDEKYDEVISATSTIVDGDKK